jgi:D-serine deaminase-like pyridoxal phosphate-dependent protein
LVAPAELEEVTTPALVVDRARLLRNLEAMASRARSLGVALRPHAKTHKSPAIAALQREYGAAGLTVATLSEAEAFAEAGTPDVLITTPPVGQWRLARLVELARRARVRVTVDDLDVVRALERACRAAGVEVGYVWEVDCGVGRFGTPPGAPTADRVARARAGASQCSFDGVLAFGGHAYAATDRGGLVAASRQERDAIARTADALLARGIETEIRSIGTTPTSHVMDSAAGITEIRPGNYVFYDATQVALGLVAPEQCALSVLATVLSRPAPDRVILDCGSKALAAERLSALTAGFGLIEDRPDVVIERLYEEHAIARSPAPLDLRVGARVRVVPNHACAATNLHSQMMVVQDGAVSDVWPVAVRGWSAYHGAHRPAHMAAAGFGG